MTTAQQQRDERLSALLDGEIPDHEIAPAARDLMEDADLSARWHRYQLASDSLRRDLAPVTDPALYDRISAAIAAEPIYTSPHHWRRKRAPAWLQQAGGLAIAASVTAISIFGAQALLKNPAADLSSGGAVTISHTATPSAVGRPATANTDGLPPKNFELASYRTPPTSTMPAKAAGNRLNTLLLNHQEYQAEHALQGNALPYARMVNSQHIR